MNKGKENKPHIGVFGRCNVGKSTLINSLVGQDIAIVSKQAGTTTDSVKKSMEIKGVGAVVLIDTAGIDDESELGKKRIEKALEVFSLIDLAIIVFTDSFFEKEEEELIDKCNKNSIPYILVHNKGDIKEINPIIKSLLEKKYKCQVIETKHGDKENNGISYLTQAIQRAMPQTAYQHKGILDGLIEKNSVVLLVTPIDSSAPEGRMILPQVQLIRDVLDHDAINIVVKETQLEQTLKLFPNPDLVITDSQAFESVSKIIPESIPLTSFSIVLARLKGEFLQYLKGTPEIENLKDGDRVLMLESCSHQASCEDIGRVKLPNWIKKYTNKDIEFEAVAGLSNINRPITDYAMIIQCGGCMVTQKQISSRLRPAIEAGIPVSNYGICIAYLNGIFNRATKMFI